MKMRWSKVGEQHRYDFGWMITGYSGRWFVFNERGSIVHRAKTLAAAKREAERMINERKD